MSSCQGAISVWDYNAYTPIYQHAHEVLRMYDAPDYTVKLCVVPGNDPRRYNLPTADEVGVILPGENLFQGVICDCLQVIFLPFPSFVSLTSLFFSLDIMARQSQHIRCPSYQPRTTWSLPEIISVCIFSSLSLPVLMFD